MAFTTGREIFEFGRFRLETGNHLLLRDGEVVTLAPKAIDTLQVLLQCRGQVISKDELITRLWPDTIVEPANLTQNIYLLRKALGEGPHDQNYIETIPKRGYRFVAPVRVMPDDPGVERADVTLRDVRETETQPSPAPRPPRNEDETLALNHSGRFAETRLRGGVAALVIATVACGSIYLWLSSKPIPSGADVNVRSLVVLPFKPIGAESRDEILELGMADTLITKLGDLKQIVVRPTSAVRKYRSLEQDPVAAGREQKADLVLEGSIQRVGARIRVTVRLLNVRGGRALLTETFDESMSDVFVLQDSISDGVVRALTLKLTDEERVRLGKRSTANADAFQLYLKGRYFWDRRTADGLQKAIAFFQEAIQRDPTYALAYVGLADVYISLPYDNDSAPSDVLPKARAAAARALEIDDGLADAHAASGFVKGIYEWDWAGAERELRRALELNTNSATAHQRYANYLIVMGRDREAIDETRRALALDPVSLAGNALAGRSYYFARRYDQAIEQCGAALDLDRTFWIAHFFRGKAYAQKGLYADAAAELRKAGDVTSETLATIGYVEAVSGNRFAARNVVADLVRRSSSTYVPPSHVAKIEVALGENDQAIAWLEKAYQAHDAWLEWLATEPQWDPLRADSRFIDLLGRLGLPSTHRM